MPTIRPSIRTKIAALAGVAALTFALAGCQAAGSGGGATDAATDSSANYITPGKITIGTSEPAYFPWIIDDKPESGQGFESAVAYAVAKQLGFDKSDVVWVRDDFDASIAPGPKDFDFNLQQFSITDDRKKNVDFSSPYYVTTQTVITTKDSTAAGAKSIADLKGFTIGAAVGTTSFDAIEKQIKPTNAAQAFNTNDDAVAALQANQVDALVVDLPTAFYITGAQIDNGLIIGQLPATGDGDQFGLVLAKDSPLTADVTKAVDALKADGTLDDLAQQWLSDSADAPVLK
jgi:polar amino acid transport system substrate-binding protein